MGFSSPAQEDFTRNTRFLYVEMYDIKILMIILLVQIIGIITTIIITTIGIIT